VLRVPAGMENLSTRAVMEDVAAQVVGSKLIEPLQNGPGNSIGSEASGGSSGIPIPQRSRFEDEEIIEEAKYHSPAPVPPADEGELPDVYSRPRVTLMVVNPYLVYAYWNVDLTRLPPQTVSATLRFHDESEPVRSHFFDVDVDLRTRNWYVHLWSSAKSYHVDLGVRTADGGFTVLARSNRFQTPRAWPMAEVEHPATAAATASLPVTEPVSPGAAEPARAEIRSQADEIAVPTGHLASERHSGAAPTAGPSQAAPGEPADAAAVLQRRLSEIYSLRPQHPRALVATPSAQYDTPLLSAHEAPLPERVEVQHAIPRPSSEPGTPFDLTGLAEHEFHPGFSSALLSSPIPGRPPG
jgi:hypothetical protein